MFTLFFDGVRARIQLHVRTVWKEEQDEIDALEIYGVNLFVSPSLGRRTMPGMVRIGHYSEGQSLRKTSHNRH